MLNVPKIAGRALPRLLALVVALAVGATVTLAGASAAGADTANGRIAHVSLDLAGVGSSQARAYRQFIVDVQAAAGHEWLPNIGETQTNQAALLRADINYDGNTLRLWFTPNNMYLRGFTTAAGVTFAFNDYELGQAMVDLAAAPSPDAGLLPPLNEIRSLPFDSGYIGMVRAAGRDRTNTPMTYANLLASFATLLEATRLPGQDSARALLFFIQYVSEAARFRPVGQMMYDVMNGVEGAGVSGNLQELENDWSALSAWAYELRAGLNPRPYYVGPHFGTINSLRQLTAAMMMLLGNINQAPPPGDFKHDEV
ncbi:MAG TPA: ribosome-inactivating family protein [Pseudonocardiaceae bacterium]